MLQQLIIDNYALIDHTDLTLDGGMSVITGETGAGKSIMLGALGMLLGQKADAQALLDKTRKCVVEATFDIADYGLKEIFAEADMEYDDVTIIRREIQPNGKSRAFVNDTPATVAFLKELGAHLIDIHSQHQNMLLSQTGFHLDVVDSMAKTQSEVAAYAAAYTQMRAKQQELQELKEINARQGKELDYNRFVLGELENAKLEEPDELERLERQQEMQDKAEEIKENIAMAINALDGDESGIVHQLGDMGRNLDRVSHFLPQEADIVSRVETARIDLDDIRQTLRDVIEKVDFDPEEQRRLTDRLNILNSLTQKHGVATVGELMSIRDELRKKVAAVDSFDERLQELTEELQVLTSAAQTKADTLSEKRQSVFADITSQIESQLHEMGMANAKFVISHAKSDLGPNGQDDIRFLFAANKNGEPTDVARVASGGEMSRVMLSIKSLLSQTKSLPTIIFDEIDTGVSGDVADKMGKIMSSMATHMQVLAITHLPQVAAKGHKHYKVYKEDTDERTISHIKQLTDDDRVTEIAKMLSGATVSDAALANARELLSNGK